MPEAELWAKCDGCDKIMSGNLVWKVENGFDVLNMFSVLARILNAHHKRYSNGLHQLFYLFRSEENAKDDKNILSVGFICMSSECGQPLVLIVIYNRSIWIKLRKYGRKPTTRSRS